jgi:hypothetical protein
VHILISAVPVLLSANLVVEAMAMLEVTQEILEKVDPLLDAGDAVSAGSLLVEMDPISLRALIIHILRERGAAVAEAVGEAYLRKNEARLQHREAA